jgi:hypothetical protein
MKTINVRDGLAELNGDKTVTTFPNGIEILADDGRTLFSVMLMDGGKIEVRTAGVCKQEGRLLEDRLLISPRYPNSVIISRPPNA